MFEKAKQARDAFTFSLGGMRLISSPGVMPAVADDRINKIRDAQLKMLETRRAEAARKPERRSHRDPQLCTQRA